MPRSIPTSTHIRRARLLLALVLSCLFSFGWMNAPAAQAGKPNIVFILADDLGWTDLGCQGSKYYETPNIDRLAAQGMRFTSGYTCGPNCQPTRAALMSGQYGPRTGVYTVGSIDRFDWQSRPLRPVDNVTQLPLDKITIAQALKTAGYATGMFGKWHLGKQRRLSPGQARLRRGDRLDGQALRLRHQPEGRLSEGHVPGRLPDRQGRRFHPAAQGRAVLPLPAALRRPRAARGEEGADRAIQATKPASAGTTTRPTPR